MEIKVTRIKNRFHARLILAGKIIDEMACECKQDIGHICREMLRWQDKCFNSTPWTRAARKRQTGKVFGRIWYRNNLSR